MAELPRRSETVRRPCRGCPWRTDQDGTNIPGFDLDLAEQLNTTSPDENGFGPDFGDPLFACHQSRQGEEIVCAGWLAAVGHRHPAVRLKVAVGDIDRAALEPGDDWPELHDTFATLIAKLRAAAGDRQLPHTEETA